MSNLKSYEDVLVSGVKHDFTGRSYHDVPRPLLRDWVSLIVKLGKLLHPGFGARPLADADQFETAQIPSDGPYSSSENYYMLDYVFLDLIRSDGMGVRIAFEDGRQGGGESLRLETRGVQPAISSHINRDARAPGALIYMFHDDEMKAKVEAVIAEHAFLCTQSG